MKAKKRSKAWKKSPRNFQRLGNRPQTRSKAWNAKLVSSVVSFIGCGYAALRFAVHGRNTLSLRSLNGVKANANFFDHNARDAGILYDESADEHPAALDTLLSRTLACCHFERSEA